MASTKLLCKLRMSGARVQLHQVCQNYIRSCLGDMCVKELKDGARVWHTQIELTVGTILELSRHVLSLCIVQHPDHRIHHDEQFLLGACRVHWSTVILQLFSNKLEKLLIENIAYPGYLSKICANFLIEVCCNGCYEYEMYIFRTYPHSTRTCGFRQLSMEMSALSKFHKEIT